MVPELLPFIADRSPAKQDRLIPGVRIPIVGPAEIDRRRPENILILPWPLASEISGQLSSARAWKARLFVAIPRLGLIPSIDRRPFRFIAPMPSLDLPPARWREEIRRIEIFGFSTVSVSEHLTQGWTMDPLAAMSAAVQASKRLRVLSLVLLNDLRHPVMVQRAVETIDRLSGGRVELGLGAGWRKRTSRCSGCHSTRHRSASRDSRSRSSSSTDCSRRARCDSRESTTRSTDVPPSLRCGRPRPPILYRRRWTTRPRARGANG